MNVSGAHCMLVKEHPLCKRVADSNLVGYGYRFKLQYRPHGYIIYDLLHHSRPIEIQYKYNLEQYLGHMIEVRMRNL